MAGAIPRDRYEVVLTDENIESIDFDLKADLIGISAMTATLTAATRSPTLSGRAGCRW